MAFEITCGQCGGRLLVEQTGVIVACPMCDAHLSVPDPDEAAEVAVTNAPVTDAPPPVVAPAAELEPTEFLKEALPAGDSPTLIAPPSASEPTEFLRGPLPSGDAPTMFAAPASNEPTEFLKGPSPTGEAETIIAPPRETHDGDAITLGGEPSSNPTEWISHSSPRMDEFVVPDEDPANSDLFQPPDDLPDFSGAMAADPDDPTIELTTAPGEDEATQFPTQFGRLDPVPQPPTTDALESATVVLPVPAEVEAVTEQFQASPVIATAPRRDIPASTAQPTPAAPVTIPAADVVPRQWFIMVAGYASAVTLALLFLLFGMGSNRQHALESLPDLVPPVDKSGNIGMKKVPPDLDVAPGHVLALGDAQRFGNVRVTPVKVTRGPIQFEHAFGQAKLKREPTKPVLKLMLRFENVSQDQEFAPLDATLMYKRIFESKSGKVLALNFLGREADRKSGGELHYLYDLPEFSEYLLAGQQLNHPLKPGETWETYVPSDEGLSQLDGEWVWRVLFRKGYHPASKRGVTTLIDVRFHGRDVREESAG